MRTWRTTILAVLAIVLGAGCTNAPMTPAAPSQGPVASAAPSQAPALSAAPSQAPALSAAPSQAPDRPAAATFVTPEDAISQYLAGVAQADASKILAACAVAEKSAGFSFSLYVERLQMMVLYQSMSPAEYPFYVEVNKALETSQILNRVRLLSYSLLSSEKIDGSPIYHADKARADKFVSDVNPARLADLKVIAIRLSNPKLQKDAKSLANMAATSRIYGADEAAEWLALFSLGGRDYFVGFTLLRYGAGWKVSEQVANLAGSSSLGAAEPTTVEEFDRLTSGG